MGGRFLAGSARACACAWVLLLAACGSPNDTDAGHDGALDAHPDIVTADTLDTSDTSDAPATCSVDLDCSDGVFCNGAERCTPGAAGADARGCVAANPATPCLSTQVCNEAALHCDSACDTAPDADGDGHRAMACGGDDCDDSDPHRFPGNPEVCLVDTSTGQRIDPTHDEDCDATTFANATTHDGDQDGDGFVDVACSNTDRNGQSYHGGDCVDVGSVTGSAPFESTMVSAADIHPTQPEVCNGVDDNCNGMVDEALPVYTYEPDCDGDHYGRTGAGVMSCAPPTMPPAVCAGAPGSGWANNANDCDDADAHTYPGATELCDGHQNDCTGTWVPEDADHDGHIAVGAPCAGMILPVDDCRDDIADVHPGQTAYFTTAACPPGSSPCTYIQAGSHGVSTTYFVCLAAGQTCPAFPCTSSCPLAVPGAPTWNYNCVNGDEPQPSTPALCSNGPGHDTPCFGNGVTYTGTPACGSPVTGYMCSGQFVPVGQNCPAPTTTTVPLGCH